MSPDFNLQFFKSWRFLAVGVLLLCFILGIAYFFYGISPLVVGEQEKTVFFRISRGEGFRGIAARLSQEGVIRSITMFKVYSFATGRAQRFQPGLYFLAPTMNVPEIVKTLTVGGGNEVTVTVPEGATLKDVDFLLSEQQVLPQGMLLSYDPVSLYERYPFLLSSHSLEGFLFPDTYRFELESDPDAVVSRFLDTFSRKAWGLLRERDNWYDRLVLASFLEKEVPEFRDRRVVAGILLRRLEQNMPLQVDATITYAKCNGLFLVCNDVRFQREDYDLASPYNTYRERGLTPTPIANPGREAIMAALDPEESSYWYYLSRGDTKETVFARTFDEHKRNKEKYL